MDAVFQALLTETLTIAAYTGVQDGYGQPTFGSPVSVPARLEYKTRRIVTATGDERLSRCRAFLEGTLTLDLRDKLILPDGTSPPMQLIYAPRDEGGAIDHYEVYF